MTLMEELSAADLPRDVREAILARQGRLCFYCDEPIDGNKYVLDHVVPRNAGGPHQEWNRVAAHGACDAVKGSRLPTDDEMLKLDKQRGLSVSAG